MGKPHEQKIGVNRLAAYDRISLCKQASNNPELTLASALEISDVFIRTIVRLQSQVIYMRELCLQ